MTKRSDSKRREASDVKAAQAVPASSPPGRPDDGQPPAANAERRAAGRGRVVHQRAVRRRRWALVAAVTLAVAFPLVVNLPTGRDAGSRQNREAVMDATRPPSAPAIGKVVASGAPVSPPPADAADTRAPPPREKPRLVLFTGAVNYIPLLTLIIGGAFCWSARRNRDSGVWLVIHGLMTAAFGVLELFMIYATRAAAQAFLSGEEASVFAQYADLLAAASALTLVAVGVNVFTQGLLLQDRPEDLDTLLAEVRGLREELRGARRVEEPEGG